jgi:hypothetical protein
VQRSAIICCIKSGPLEARTVRLARSIRRFGGRPQPGTNPGGTVAKRPSSGVFDAPSPIYATGSDKDQDLILKAKGAGGKVKITGTLEAKDFAADANPLRNRMYPEAPIVYQDIFEALNARAIEKLGNPSYDDTQFKAQSPWKDRPMIRFGGANEANGNGALVTIPSGFDTVWVRVCGDRWNDMLAYFKDGEDLGRWTGGLRSANSYAPDGTLADSYAVEHQ